MNSDFCDLLRLLNAAKVKYLIIGGYAVSYFSEPRYTKDLDIWVEASRNNSRKLVEALRQFGAPTDNLEEFDFEDPSLLYVFGIAPSRVDILAGVKGFRFQEAWKRRVMVEYDDIRIPFISVDDLIRMKKKAARVQDKADVEALEASKRIRKKRTSR